MARAPISKFWTAKKLQTKQLRTAPPSSAPNPTTTPAPTPSRPSNPYLNQTVLATMGKDKSEKKDKKEKKPKTVEVNGVSKKVKKEKKDKKEKRKSDVTELLEKEVESSASPAPLPYRPAVVDADGDADMSDAEAKVQIVGALVPFANPLADDKQTKKVMKGVKKGMFLFCRSGGASCAGFTVLALSIRRGHS